MFNFKKLVILCLALVAFGGAAWCQSVAPTYYVSGGPNIYAVSANGTAQVIYTNAGSNFESLAIGPDWVDFDSSNFHNALYPFLLYACDTALNQVIRLAPANSTPWPWQLVSGAVTAPVCGRSSAAGDFYVSSKTGSGVFKFSGLPLASISFSNTSLARTPIPVVGSAGITGEGLTQKNVGDLLVVDQAQNLILQFPYATDGFGLALPSPIIKFINSSLNVPVGIARFSNGDLFVSNSVPTKGKNGAPQVAHFTGSGAAAGSCPALSFRGSQTPAFVASAENDLLYVVSTGSNASTIWTWSASQGSCNLNAQATTPTVVTGIAVPPVPTAKLTQLVSATVANPTPTMFFFNSNAFQLTATGCSADVTAYPLSPATVSTMITKAVGSLPDGAVPSRNLGEGGYSVAYVAKWGGCTSVFNDGQFAESIAGLFDINIDNNNRILRCEGSANEPQVDGSTTCQVDSTIGVYPLGGFIPQDPLTTSKSTSNSTFVLVNSLPSTNANAAGGGPGIFCGYQSPLLNPPDPGYPATFGGGSKNTLSVKFKLAAAGGSCANGPYITTATALISVAQLTDAQGLPNFNPIAIGSTSIGNADVTPLYNSGNQQYAFTLTIKNYAPGTYSLTTTFLTDNETNKTILFVIK